MMVGWLHEIKHDGFRVIARKDGHRVRLYSRPGNDLTYRFPLIVEALTWVRSQSCIIDGEAVACDGNGMPSFDAGARAVHRTRRAHVPPQGSRSGLCPAKGPARYHGARTPARGAASAQRCAAYCRSPTRTGCARANTNHDTSTSAAGTH